jgi:hypothetical protein
MAGRTPDFQVIFNGLMGGVLSPNQAAALFRENKEAAEYYLCDRLGETMRDPQYKNTKYLTCSAGRLLEMYWKLFGPSKCVVMFLLHEGDVVEKKHYDIPLVVCFLLAKLHSALDEFSEEDLNTIDSRSRNKWMHQAVLEARARKLVPVADQLLRNPAELNRDIAEVKRRVSDYDFTPELNEVLDKVGEGLAAGGDQFDQAALLKHLRTFFEKLHQQAALKLRAEKPETVDGTDLTKCQQVIDYLQRKGVLTDKMQGLGRALYGVLSEEGVHALKAEREYVRFCRNWVGEYALVLFFELERRLKQ